MIKDYNNKFKKPLKNLLKNYFRIKNNPDLKMEDRILEELGFVPCGNCYNFSTKEVKSDSFVKKHGINNEYEKDTSDFDVCVHDDIGFGPGINGACSR